MTINEAKIEALKSISEENIQLIKKRSTEKAEKYRPMSNEEAYNLLDSIREPKSEKESMFEFIISLIRSVGGIRLLYNIIEIFRLAVMK